jgi:hypothetical protein
VKDGDSPVVAPIVECHRLPYLAVDRTARFRTRDVKGNASRHARRWAVRV